MKSPSTPSDPPPGRSLSARFWDRVACALAGVSLIALMLLISGLFVRASVEGRWLSKAPIPFISVLALAALFLALPLSVYAFILGRRHAGNAKRRGPDS